MTKLKTQSVPDMLRPRIIEAIQSDPSHQFLQGVFATSEEEENFIKYVTFSPCCMKGGGARCPKKNRP